MFAALARDRIGGEQPGVLDDLDARQPLEHRVHLADVDRPAERPAVAVGATTGRVEVAVQRIEALIAERVDGEPPPGPDAGDDGDTLVARRLDDDPRADRAPLVELGRDPRQRVVVGHELLEPQPAVAAVGHGGDDEDPHSARAVVVVVDRQRPHACDLGRRLAGELLVVLGGHRPVAGAQHDRTPHLGVLEILAVDPTDGGEAVDDAVDGRDRRTQRP